MLERRMKIYRKSGKFWEKQEIWFYANEALIITNFSLPKDP